MLLVDGLHTFFVYIENTRGTAVSFFYDVLPVFKQAYMHILRVAPTFWISRSP